MRIIKDGDGQSLRSDYRNLEIHCWVPRAPSGPGSYKQLLCYTRLGRSGGALVPLTPWWNCPIPCSLLPSSTPPTNFFASLLFTTFSCYENCFLNFSLLFFDPSILTPIGAYLSPVPHCFPSQQTTSSSPSTSLPPAAPQALLLHPPPPLQPQVIVQPHLGSVPGFRSFSMVPSSVCSFAIMQALLLSTLFRASALQAWWLLICGVKTVLIRGRICSTHLATFNRQTKFPMSLPNMCYTGLFNGLWFNYIWVVFHGKKKGVVLIKRPSMPNSMSLLEFLLPSITHQLWAYWTSSLCLFISLFLHWQILFFLSQVLTNMMNKFWLKKQNHICGWHPESKNSSQIIMFWQILRIWTGILNKKMSQASPVISSLSSLQYCQLLKRESLCIWIKQALLYWLAFAGSRALQCHGLQFHWAF